MKHQQLLADWSYSPKEWNQFVDLEKANKKQDNIYFGVAIMIMIPPVLMFLRGTTFLTGLLFAIPFAFLIPFLRIKFAYKHLKKNVLSPYVKIFENEIVVNGKKIQVVGSRRRIKKVKIIDTKIGIKLLEVDIQWLTGKGPTNDEYRFPIPNGEEQTAKKLVNLVHQ